MKKIFFSLLAIAAIASCAKTADVYTEENSEIKLSPVTSIATKANVKKAIDDIAYPTGEDFDVFAYWKNEPAGSTFNTDYTNYLISTDATGVEFINKGQFWGGNTTYYWPKNGSLRFAAYSPADLDMTHVLGATADTYTLANHVYPTNTADTYEILVAPTSKSYTAQTAAEKVSVVFEHALSWITFKLVTTEVANNAFTVKGLILNDLKYTGTLTADMAADTKTWDLTDATNNMFVYNQAGNTTAVTTTAAAYEDVENGVLVLPQATTTLTINYTQNALAGTPALDNQSVTIPLTLDENQPWDPGKHYTYTVIFDLDEILINPSVEYWVEVEVPTIDATATSVATEEELLAAVAAGQSVRLTSDINLTKSIKVGNSVVTKAAAPVELSIDLNGKSIIAASTDAIVVTDGANLTIYGDGNVKAATDNKSSANALWIKHGNVTINGGNYYVGADNAQRNDCIYLGAASQKDNAAAYVSTLVINGGTFEAAVEELGQYWVLNIQDQHKAAGSTITVNGGKFKNFDPSNNTSEGANTNFLGAGKTSTKEGDYYIVK